MRILLAFFLLVAVGLPARAETVTVFAAASLKTVLDTVGPSFTAATGTSVVFSYAGTSVLARQIEQGAPADLFVSAHQVWFDYLAERDLIDTALPESQPEFWQGSQPESLQESWPESRPEFWQAPSIAGNALVLVAPASQTSRQTLDLSKIEDWQDLLGEDGLLAVALTSGVPAGLYAKEALENLGVWQALQPRLAQSDNVRSALFLVARGEVPLGIVYATDAMAEPRVDVVARFASDLHQSITYQAALVSQSDSSAALEFLRYLRSDAAQGVFEAAGFEAVPCTIVEASDDCDEPDLQP